MEDDSFTYTLSNGTTTAVATATLSIAAAPPEFTAPAGLRRGFRQHAGYRRADRDRPQCRHAVTATFGVEYGTINLNTSLLTGGSVSGNGTDSVIVTASLTEINAMLASPSNVVYTPGSGFMGDTLTVTENNGSEAPSSTSVPISAQATGSIFSVSQVDSYVLESSGVAEVTVERQGDLGSSASVEYTTVNGSATASNFTAVSGTLSFATGQVLATMSVAVTTGVSLTGGNEYFTFNLGTPSSGATITTDNGQIYLLSSGDTPVLVNNDYTVANGQALSAGPGSSQPSLLAGDFDMLGDLLSVTAVDNTSFSGSITKSTSYGTVTVKSDGSFVFTPSSGPSSGGLDSFTYTVQQPGRRHRFGHGGDRHRAVPPQITGLPGAISVPEGGYAYPAYTYPYISGITISDPNESGDPNVIVTLWVQKGSLTCSGSPRRAHRWQ